MSSTGLKTSSSRGTGIPAALGTSKPGHKDRLLSETWNMQGVEGGEVC